MSNNEIASVMLGNLLDEQIMMTQLCTALSRSNVKLTDVPVPEKLARKREKMRKIPLYDYTAVSLPGVR
ncbi:hypothetical protein [Sphingomonas sp. Ant20]|jgi:hypothetical protein|uniref:hypothetical protein n=1 Tax=Sphingomonas sp. Ant20 TaxID=104605 RepID=UPI000FE14630|nr:hypothetical protein [Sphingomonas sp. Ant20]